MTRPSWPATGPTSRRSPRIRTWPGSTPRTAPNAPRGSAASGPTATTPSSAHDGERLREHYRRLLYARRHFALTVSRRFYGGRDAYRSGSEELDDRGVIYVRHGEPRTRLRPFVFGLMPNETWRYDRADGDLLFHFSAGYDDAGGGDLYDYRLVESVLDLRGASDAPIDQLLLSRQTLSPLYGRMLNWGPYGAARAERPRAGHRPGEHRLRHDDGQLRAAVRPPAHGDRQPDRRRRTERRAARALRVRPGPAGDHARRGAEGVSYPVRVRVVVLDGAEHAVAHADTALVFRLDRAARTRPVPHRARRSSRCRRALELARGDRAG